MLTVFARLLSVVIALLVLSSPALAATTVLFDSGHAQPFRIDGSGPLDLSALADQLEQADFTVASTSTALTSESLAGADVLVISGPFKPLSAAELEVVTSYLESGGGLALMLHIAAPVRDLLQRLDVDYANRPLREQEGVIDGNPLDFTVTRLADHPVTRGLESFSVYGAWALRGTSPGVQVIASSSANGWVDLDQDGSLGEQDARQSFAVMVAGELGRGRYVVLGDDAVFQNNFLDEANRALAVSMLDWLARR